VLFEGMEFIDDPTEFSARLPLMSAGRDFSDPVALNWFTDGTDVDFGALTQQLLNFVGRTGTDIYYGHDVTNLSKQSDGSWVIKVRNLRTKEKRTVHA
ncbi:malate:quinone oxidoreductase, partial [Streptomyces sp. SID10244]|nr:malate:quinone oxidoreductase [Streptomyces sp. SID10244]